MSRITLTQKFYKEDCCNIIQNFSILQLQEILGVNLTDKNEILDFLMVGLKKEDLNFCLSNSLKVIDKLPFREELMNKQKNRKIVRRECLENIFDTREENTDIFHTDDETKSNFDTREEKIDEIPPTETRIFRIISHPDPENKSNFDTDDENKSNFDTNDEIPLPKLTTDFLEENTRNLWNADDAEIDCNNTEEIDKTYSDFSIQFKKDIQDNIDESIKKIEQITNNTNTNLQQLVKSKATKYQIVQALNERNKKIKQQQDIFQFTMKQKLKYQIIKYEREKHKFSFQDSNYQFKQKHILPLCRLLNIDYDERMSDERMSDERMKEILNNRRKK
jgi:hypothetical protein